MLCEDLREASHTTPHRGIKTPDPAEFAFYSNFTANTIETIEPVDKMQLFAPIFGIA
jgi:hypothetical protein